MGHDGLINHFKTNFALMQHHKWSLTDTETMMPWERYIYIDLLHNYLKEEEQRLKDLENQRKANINSLNRQQAARRR